MKNEYFQIQIGELVGRFSEEFLEENNKIPWHAIKACGIYMHMIMKKWI